MKYFILTAIACVYFLSLVQAGKPNQKGFKWVHGSEVLDSAYIANHPNEIVGEVFVDSMGRKYIFFKIEKKKP